MPEPVVSSADSLFATGAELARFKRMLKMFEQQGTCMVWTGGRSGDYGSCYFQGRTWAVHRLMWTLFVGPITEGFHILHKCDNKLCANLKHLYEGTRSQNGLDFWQGHPAEHIADLL